MLGREVYTLVNKNLTSGDYQYNLRKENLGKGVYYIKMLFDEQILIQKIIVE